MNKIIEVNNLGKKFKIRSNRNLLTGLFRPDYVVVDAVNDISFEVTEGESLAFLGPNGAGKTTTTKMLTGLMYPTTGKINVMGYTPFDRKKEFLLQIGLVMGNKTGLSWDLTAEQNFDFIRRIYRIETSAYTKRLSFLSELLGLSPHLHKQVRKLSLGERMKMELVGAILHNPKILFLDEPTIGLDITSKKNMRIFLREIQKNSNITIILTSHDMDDVEKVCDRVLVINKGYKVYDDSLQSLVNDYNQKKFIRVYFSSVPKNLELFNYAKMERGENDTVTFEVSKENTSRLISDIVSQTPLLDIDVISVPLEEIIEDIFEKSGTVTTLS